VKRFLFYRQPIIRALAAESVRAPASCAGKVDMMRYRYRNTVLLGKWFDNREEALNDAVQAGQASRTPDGSLEWVDHGSLEEETGGICEIVRPAY
jgi:hypothetical protein